MKKTKDEILMVALGVKHFTSLEMWQKEQLYYAMDEWATQHQTAQLQQPVVSGKLQDVIEDCLFDFKNEDKPLSVCVALILAACATAQGRPA
jgi:ribonuclease HIII